MQKHILFNVVILILGISISIFYSSNARTEKRVLSSSESQLALAYSNQVSYYYTLTAKKTEILYETINNFLADPSENSLKIAKVSWIEARKIYGITEAFRFYGGPIDGLSQFGEEGPEGLINSWPLNEAYIDYVEGNPEAGLINNLNFKINSETILASNQSGDDADVSTGWHAIEFLLWGQDSSLEDSGTRPFADFILGKNNNDRRRAYLSQVSLLLLNQVKWLKEQWSADGEGRRSFLSDDDPGGLILTGLTTLAGFELSSERIATALDSGDPEDEHSCFSDQTHNDIRANFNGIKNIYLGLNSKGERFFSSVSDLVAENNPSLNASIISRLKEVSNNIEDITVPFDKMLLESNDGPGRIAAEKTVNNLLALAENFKKAGKGLNWQVIISE